MINYELKQITSLKQSMICCRDVSHCKKIEKKKRNKDRNSNIESTNDNDKNQSNLEISNVFIQFTDKNLDEKSPKNKITK